MARTSDYENWQIALRRNLSQAEKHAADIDAVIDGLGIREAYPNETIESKEPSYYGGSPFGQYHMQTVTRTHFGRTKFLADVRLAADAARGSEAAARIAAALKSKK